MSLFKKQSHQPDRKQVQNIQDTPKHPVLQIRRKNKNKKHDHLDNYVQIRPFADAEFSWWSFTSYKDQFDELYNLFRDEKLKEARELCGKNEQDIWKKLYYDAIDNFEDTRAEAIVRVYKWLVDGDTNIPPYPPYKIINFDVKNIGKEIKRRKKLGYNKENPWSQEKERMRKVEEDEYIKTNGNPPIELEYWQEWWKQQKKMEKR